LAARHRAFAPGYNSAPRLQAQPYKDFGRSARNCAISEPGP